ncbi:MAG: hypothetical protein CLLPBCKN_002969 [Chroococcidiopsis cubana SAG 39.79]|nr:hypothetical protein [Chroococcidiopsis cubana SAG 39.79]
MRPYLAQPYQLALEILDCCSGEEPMTVETIAQKVAINKNTARQVLSALREGGLILLSLQIEDGSVCRSISNLYRRSSKLWNEINFIVTNSEVDLYLAQIDFFKVLFYGNGLSQITGLIHVQATPCSNVIGKSCNGITERMGERISSTTGTGVYRQIFPWRVRRAWEQRQLSASRGL